MHHAVLIDHEFAVAQDGYIVRALVRLTGHAPAQQNRVPINISIVLDRSGSMAGEKLEAARDAAAFLIQRLAPEDVVSVVAYDDGIDTIAMPATGTQQGYVTPLLQRIGPGGSTNLSGGWLRGRELVASHKRAGAVNRVLLLTDGLANVGITDPALLCGLAGGAKREGITTSTIGFGADYDEALLRGMADAGGGNTWYIERPDQAPGVFEEEIEGLLSLAAQNVAVEIRPSPLVKLVGVHNDYPHADLPGNARRFELGDLYAREPKSMLMEFFVPAIEAGVPTDIAEVRVHAHVLTDAGAIERQEIVFTVATPLDRSGHAEPEVRREVLVLAAARAREEAVRRERMGDRDGAARVLREVSRMIREAPPAIATGLADQVAELAASAVAVMSSGFSEADRKYEAQRSYNARRGKQAYDDKLRRPR
jgi:Ca-activated chloride channel family protein